MHPLIQSLYKVCQILKILFSHTFQNGGIYREALLYSFRNIWHVSYDIDLSRFHLGEQEFTPLIQSWVSGLRRRSRRAVWFKSVPNLVNLSRLSLSQLGMLMGNYYRDLWTVLNEHLSEVYSIIESSRSWISQRWQFVSIDMHYYLRFSKLDLTNEKC